METQELRNQVSPEKKVYEELLSRRSFLGKSGKLIALGTLALFAMVGRSNATPPSLFSNTETCLDRVTIPGCPGAIVEEMCQDIHGAYQNDPKEPECGFWSDTCWLWIFDGE